MTRKMRHTQTRRTHAWHQWVVFWAGVSLFFLSVASFFCVCVSTLVRPAGAALRHDGVRNAGAAWGPVTPWVGMAMATRDDETVTSTHQITNQSWDVHVYSQKLQITGERLRHYQIVRSKLRFESQLTDLFSGSLGVWLRSFFSKKLQD